MITSPDNPRVRAARALLQRRGREQTGRCLIEGVRLVEDATRAGIAPALVLFTAQAAEAARVTELLGAAERMGALLLETSPAILGTLSDTVTSQGIVAVIPIPQQAPLTRPSLVIVLDRVRDPGNLGTILRSAAGAGADAILMTPGCVDPWNPKVLRAGMGAHFRMPIVAASTWEAIAGEIATLSVWRADSRGGTVYDAVDWTIPSALILGGETEGLSAEAEQLTPQRVTIPMAREVESLNAAMAATVVLFEAARQRRNRGPADCTEP